MNQRIAVIMLAGALAAVADPEGDAVFAIKGGVAMQLRLGDRARATRDVDLIMRGDTGRLADLLDAGLHEPYREFTFRRAAIAELPTRPHVKKTRVQVSFAGRSLTSLLLEIAPMDTGAEEFTQIAGADLTPVGLDGPDVVPVLAERWQIAQKLHAVTETFDDGRENPRFRDLIDLQLLAALEPDPPSVRPACERVFQSRGQQAWPPTITAQASWTDPYRATARELDLPTIEVADAVPAVQAFVDRIAAA